ncbi:glutathione transferase GstA [Stenotrophomonas sp. 24(2023)]|uniref:glutathione transferase GstA n=1 Tax=Stenotrophomonas sp. 24(2023) TaxID=3068324 RepID=UPI0027E0C112|nr:glutathione transferase GstA [Stenotrophomonas sp. 24(2023)]WMJ70452.1 glutathione transferase GstA [Stenotrophomonas sp. 24(2023)]
MKLYYALGSCGLSPQIALREAGLAFELVKVDFATKQTDEGDYLAVTPKGFVPALALEDGDVLTEGAVILQWIADQHPQHALLPPPGSRERYTALEWLNFVATDLHKGMAVMFSPLVGAASKARFAEGNLASRFAHVDAHLHSNDYLLGDSFSLADAYLYNVLCWPPRVGIDLSAYTAIAAYMARMAQRPSVQAARQAEGLPND